MGEQLAEPTPRPDGSDTETSQSRPTSAVTGGRAHRAVLGKLVGTMTTVLIVAALVVGTYALYRIDRTGHDSPELTQRFQLDLTQQYEVPGELLGYREQGRFPVAMQQLAAIAAGRQGEVLVAGDRAIQVLNRSGKVTATIDLSGPPSCLAVAGAQDEQPGRVYVAVGQHVSVLSPTYELVQEWPELDAKSTITAIAVSGKHVFVADAGNRLVWHYDSDGKVLGKIGEADPGRQMPGFVVPSPYFDLAVDGDEVLHVVNPGMRRIEAYNFDGQLQSYWGVAGAKLADFFGCCNPAHLAMFPDGRFLTSEKGIPRIKVYSMDGDLQQVVAGPRQLGVEESALGDAREFEGACIWRGGRHFRRRPGVGSSQAVRDRISTNSSTVGGQDMNRAAGCTTDRREWLCGAMRYSLLGGVTAMAGLLLTRHSGNRCPGLTAPCETCGLLSGCELPRAQATRSPRVEKGQG